MDPASHPSRRCRRALERWAEAVLDIGVGRFLRHGNFAHHQGDLIIDRLRRSGDEGDRLPSSQRKRAFMILTSDVSSRLEPRRCSRRLRLRRQHQPGRIQQAPARRIHQRRARADTRSLLLGCLQHFFVSWTLRRSRKTRERAGAGSDPLSAQFWTVLIKARSGPLGDQIEILDPRTLPTAKRSAPRGFPAALSCAIPALQRLVRATRRSPENAAAICASRQVVDSVITRSRRSRE